MRATRLDLARDIDLESVSRARVGTRTRDLFLTKEVLYQLSYASFSAHVRRESNPQPPVLETGALPIELRT
jgi:hypothetical protein